MFFNSYKLLLSYKKPTIPALTQKLSALHTKNFCINAEVISFIKRFRQRRGRTSFPYPYYNPFSSKSQGNVNKWTKPFWITILLYWFPMLFILPLWRDKTYKLYFNKQQDKSHIARDVKSFHAHLLKKRQILFPAALSDYWKTISLSTISLISLISPIPLAHARMLFILPVHSKAFAPLAAVAPCVCFICSVRFSKRSRAGLTMSAR